MSYSQNIQVTVTCVNTAVLKIQNAALAWGKFYSPDMSDEIQPSVVDGYTPSPGNPVTVNSCGRDGAASGTQGSFTINDSNGVIATYSWDCPWSGTNTNGLVVSNPAYVVSLLPNPIPTGGAIGAVTLTVVSIG